MRGIKLFLVGSSITGFGLKSSRADFTMLDECKLGRGRTKRARKALNTVKSFLITNSWYFYRSIGSFEFKI